MPRLREVEGDGALPEMNNVTELKEVKTDAAPHPSTPRASRLTGGIARV